MVQGADVEPDRSFDDRQFREVLGHMPTGVVVVTAIAADGKPVGMAVGSFTSVSLDPPLVAFLPARTSTSFTSMRGAHSFCVNVLAAKQENVCRQFAISGGDKFAGLEWRPAPSGAPIIDGVVAWMDCEFERVDEAGDHYIAIGRVRHLSAGLPAVPLVFFQGGYGSFATSSLAMGVSADMLHSLSLIDRAREDIEALAADVGYECHAQVLKGDKIAIVASAYPQDTLPSALLGLTFPVVPPWGEAFMAWRPVQEQTDWMERIRVPSEDRDRLLDEMSSIRTTGFSVTVWRSTADVANVINIIKEHGPTPAVERQLAGHMIQTGRVADVASLQDISTLGTDQEGSVASISAPVFDTNGELVLVINIHRVALPARTGELEHFIHRLRETTQRVSSRLGA